MAVRSRRLAGPIPLAGAADTSLLVVPAGRTVIVKSLRAVNVTGAEQLLDVCVNVHDTAHAVLWRTPVLAGRVFGDALWWVLEAGDELIGHADAADALTVTVSGAMLVDV